MENIKIGLQINSNTKSETADAKKLHDQLKQAADAAGKIKVGGVAKAAAQPAGGAMAAAQPTGSQAIQQYGAMRGTAGQTGASARDFANQAQGLSGLVRLYAIYAANVYAVGAAFGALSRAVDTANLTKGMQQLGAQSGTSLGTLSQGLVAATGYAINLREAMQATVKVTAAGLGASQVERLGKVATNASQALGVDINDAISRLSRGITKLEPELLDELGLFTKLEESTEKYARSVGKTAGQITDFEKRQAFANAVLAEGEKKFGALQLDANPYNKLSAALTNLVQQGLEFTNKFLIPVIDLLSRSPTALAGAIAAVGFTILKQAVPAITSLREGLQQKAGSATQAAAQKAQESIALRQKLSAEMIKIAEAQADKELGAVIRAENKMMELRQKGVKMGPGLERAFAKPEVKDVSERELRGIEAESRRLAKAGEIEKAEFYKESAKAIRDSKNAELEYAKVRAENISQAEKDINNKRSIIGLNQKMAESLEKASVRSSIAANAAYAGSLIGITGGLKLLNAEIKENNITGFSKGLLLARGSVAVLGGALSTLGSYLSGALMWFGLIASILPVVIGFFSKTAEESQKTSEALKGLDTSTKTLSDTLDVINKKSILEQFNAESVQAKANAVGGLAEQVAKVVEASNRELEKMGGVDIAVNFVKKLWSGDVESQATETISKGLAAAVAGIDENSEAGRAFIETVKNITKIEDISSFEKLKSAIQKLPDSKGALVQLSAELDKVGTAGKISAAKLTELEESFKKVREARTKFITENIPKDSFTEYGNALIDTFFKLDLALKDPQQNLQAIVRLSEELKNVDAPKELILGITSLSDSAKELQTVEKVLSNINKQIATDTAKLADLRYQAKLRGGEGAVVLKPQIDALVASLEKLKEYKDTQIDVKVGVQTKVQGVIKQLEEAQYLLLEKGSQAVASRLSAEFTKAGATITSALAGVLSGTQAGIEMKARADKAMLQAQLASLRAQEALIKSQIENTIAIKEETVERLKDRVSRETNVNRAEAINTQILQAQKEISASKQVLRGGSYAQFTKNLPKGDIQDMRAAMSQAQALEGTRAAIQNVLAQMQATDIQKLAASTELEAQNKLKVLDAELKLQQLQRDQLANAQAINSATNEQAVIARQEADRQLKAAQDAYKLEEASVKIKVYQAVLARTSNIEQRSFFEKAINEQKDLVELTKKTRPQEQANQFLKDQIELVKVRSAQETQTSQREFQSEARRLQAAEDILEFNKQRFELDKQRFQLTEKFVIQEQAEQDRAAARVKAARDLFEAEKTRRTETAAQESARQEVLVTGATTEDGFAPAEMARLAEIDIATKNINTNYATTVQRTTAILNNTLNSITAQEQLNLKQAEYNLLLTQTQGVGDSLKGIFEGLGSSADKFAQGIGNFVNTFAEVGIQAEKNAEAVSKWQQTLSDPNLDPQDRAKAESELGKAKQKQTKDELSGNIKLVSSAKSLFKEKSTGYKVLGAIEKAMHIAKLAMAVKEMFFDTANTAKSVANSATRGSASVVEAGIDGVKAVVKAISSLPFPANLLAGAATAAVIGGLLSKIGGDKPSVSGGGGVSAEQRQETQGTAMGYNAQGEKVRVREGVFGDTSAKSESIANSLEIIKDNSVRGLDYDNKLLKAFEKLSKSLETAAGALYSTTGITTGSAFGTQEGTRGSNFLGFSLSKTTTSIVDSGIRLAGNFLQLANATGGVIEGFETVQTTRKRAFGRTRTSIDTSAFGLDNSTTQAIQDSFGSAADIIYELGDEIGLGVANITNALNSAPPVNELISLRGLKGEELQQQLQAVMGAVIDDAALAVFGTLATTYRKFGEGALETVTRVVRTNTLIEQQLGNIGGTGIARTLGVDVTEALADAAGGLQSFIEKTDGFIDKFLTDAEKLAPVQRAVSTELKRLGLGWVDTRQEFNSVVQSLDLTTASGQATFTALMNIADGFDQVTTAAEKTFDAVKSELKSVAEQRISELKGARDEFQNFAKSLREYSLSLKTGSLSPLTPQEQYQALRTEFLTTRALAQAGDTGAIGRLSSISSSFLQMSQKMFASSGEYISDFNLVSESIDDAASFAEQQVDIANQTLTQIKNVVGALVDLKVETVKLPVALTSFGTELTAALAKYNATPKPAAMGMAFDSGGIRKYAMGGVVTQMTPFQYSGGLGVMGEAGPEAIMPLRRMPGGELGVIAGGNREMQQQLAKLNQQVAELTQVVAQGAVMNAKATDRNTEAVVAAVGDTAETMEYKNKLTNRMQIV